MQEQKRVTGSKKFLHWIHCWNKHVELYLEVALYYLLSSWWATEHSSGYLHIFWVSKVDSSACVGTMVTLPVVPGIAHLNTACRWSLWVLVCADIQQDTIIDFLSPKLSIMLAFSFFHSLPQSLLQLYLRPVGFNLFILKTSLQGRQAALCPVYWDVRTHSKAARITWDFTTPLVWGQPPVPQESWWAVWLLIPQHNAEYLHFTAWGWLKLFWLAHKSKSILCPAAWARRLLWGKHCPEMPDIWGFTLGVCSGAESWCQCTSFSMAEHPLSLMKISLPSEILVNVVIMKVQIF